MKEVKERLQQLRAALGLSQKEFAHELGISMTQVSYMETGVRGITDKTLRLIALKFHVNYFWLRDGVGDMFESIPKSLIDQLAQMYQLTDLEVRIISAYLLLPDEKKAVFRDFLNTVLKDGDRKR